MTLDRGFNSRTYRAVDCQIYVHASCLPTTPHAMMRHLPHCRHDNKIVMTSRICRQRCLHALNNAVKTFHERVRCLQYLRHNSRLLAVRMHVETCLLRNTASLYVRCLRSAQLLEPKAEGRPIDATLLNSPPLSSWFGLTGMRRLTSQPNSTVELGRVASCQ